MATFTMPAVGGQLYNQNIAATVAPGDTIVLTGDYNIINLANVNGTLGNPITIIANTPVNVFTNTGYGIIVQGRYWRFLGQGNVVIAHPTFSNNGFSFGISQDFEIDGIEIRNCKAGLFGNPSTGGTRENIRFTNINIYNIMTNLPMGQGTAEGIYFGATNLQNTYTSGYNNVLFENIYMDGLDGDGLQMAVTQNAIVRNVTIKNYGRKNINGQKAGILVGGSSQAIIEDCLVENGTGAGLQVYGVNKTIVRDTSFINTGQGNFTDDAIYIEKKSDMPEALEVEFDRVTINGALRNGVRNVNAIDVLLLDCIITNTVLGPTIGPNIRIETSPPAPVTKVPIFALFADGTWTSSDPIKTLFTNIS